MVIAEPAERIAVLIQFFERKKRQRETLQIGAECRLLLRDQAWRRFDQGYGRGEEVEASFAKATPAVTRSGATR